MMHLRLNWHALLSTFQHIWRYLLAEPYTWLFFCFFQPTRFGTEYEQQSFLKRIVLIFRLALPLFLLSYPFAVAQQLLLSNCFPSCNSIDLSSITMNVLLLMVQATALGIGCGMVAGMLGDIGLGIVLSIALGMTGILVGNVAGGFTRGVTIALVL